MDHLFLLLWGAALATFVIEQIGWCAEAVTGLPGALENSAEEIGFDWSPETGGEGREEDIAWAGRLIHAGVSGEAGGSGQPLDWDMGENADQPSHTAWHAAVIGAAEGLQNG